MKEEILKISCFILLEEAHALALIYPLPYNHATEGVREHLEVPYSGLTHFSQVAEVFLKQM